MSDKTTSYLKNREMMLNRAKEYYEINKERLTLIWVGILSFGFLNYPLSKTCQNYARNLKFDT